MEAPPPPPPGSLTRPCFKCRTQEATLESRTQPVCQTCFQKFITSKTTKHLGALGRLTRPPLPSLTRHYTLALSLGPSSTTLLHLLHANLLYSLTKNPTPPYRLLVVHITNDALPSSPPTSPTAPLIPLYPEFTFLPLPLSTALSLPTIDFSALPAQGSGPPAVRLQTLLSGLPSAASRADVLRLLTRHVLLHAAREAGSQALLMGHTTTALAELTLSEAAKGRGFGVPWVVSDGPAPGPDGDIIVSHPLREVLRGEVVRYVGMVEPALLVLEKEVVGDKGAVVSHRDLSIDEVMRRYFGEVEERYPAVVANVARTTGKLVRMLGEGGGRCGVCGMGLDGEGDERWRGELGGGGTGEVVEGAGAGKGRLCYGCERSTRG
ncbi:hypothetical protein QBC39DRAFT_405242 [Podospora conica]|nr:hypothetical protein QBC39DRAFT_405242 [Schizothecium conicum]